MKLFLFLLGVIVGAGATLALSPDPSWAWERFQSTGDHVPEGGPALGRRSGGSPQVTSRRGGALAPASREDVRRQAQEAVRETTSRAIGDALGGSGQREASTEKKASRKSRGKNKEDAQSRKDAKRRKDAQEKKDAQEEPAQQSASRDATERSRPSSRPTRSGGR